MDPPHTGSRARAIIGRMYVPAHFQPSDDEVRDALRHLGAVDLVTATDDGLLATLMPMLWDEPGSRPGPRAMGRAGRAHRAQQRPVADARDRRGDGHRPRARRLHLPPLVCRQARARARGPDVELRHRPCTRPAGHPRRRRLAGDERPPPHRQTRGAMPASPGPSTTHRAGTSTGSSAPSSGSRSSSTESSASGSSGRTGPRRMSRAPSKAWRRPASMVYPRRCGRLPGVRAPSAERNADAAGVAPSEDQRRRDDRVHGVRPGRAGRPSS